MQELQYLKCQYEKKHLVLGGRGGLGSRGGWGLVVEPARRRSGSIQDGTHRAWQLAIHHLGERNGEPSHTSFGVNAGERAGKRPLR